MRICSGFSGFLQCQASRKARAPVIRSCVQQGRERLCGVYLLDSRETFSSSSGTSLAWVHGASLFFELPGFDETYSCVP